MRLVFSASVLQRILFVNTLQRLPVHSEHYLDVGALQSVVSKRPLAQFICTVVWLYLQLDEHVKSFIHVDTAIVIAFYGVNHFILFSLNYIATMGAVEHFSNSHKQLNEHKSADAVGNGC